MKTSSKRALITGASSGIGRAMAIAMGEKGYELFLVARRKDKLEEVAAQIKNAKVHLIVADVNDKNLAEIISKETNSHVDILINNAGLALGREKVELGKFQDWQQMIDTNITANFHMVNIVLPMMLKNGCGDIINLCSIAGHYSYQGGAVYCATKHAVLAFTRALREETAGRNIRVMQISPGMVDTEFSTVRFKGDKKVADSVYAGMTPLVGEDIARMMMFMLEQPRHVVIDEIITMPQDQGSPTTIHRRSV